MISTTQQREIQEWYNLWLKIPCTRDNIQQLCRGPLKDFQNFLVRRARPNEFVETMRTNIYLDTGRQDEYISQEIDDSLFASQTNELQRLEAELKILRGEVETKLETLNKGEIKNRNLESVTKQKLRNIINDKKQETSIVLSAIENPYFSSVKPPAARDEEEESKTDDDADKAVLENLSNEAHRAFESVVLRHYMSDSSFCAPRESTIFGQLSSLVSLLMNEEFYGETVATWIRQEWLEHIQTCFQRMKHLQTEHESVSMFHNMSSKTYDTIVSWSESHVQITSKNKIRDKLVNDTMSIVQSYQNTCMSNANIGYRYGEFVSIIRRDTLKAQLIRCRQYANKTVTPIENIFNNVSLDGSKSPIPAGNLDKVIKNLDFNTNTQSLISSLSKPEQLQEIFAVLLKTWGTAKQSLSAMVSLCNITCEPLPSLLSTTAKYTCDSQKHR